MDKTQLQRDSRLRESYSKKGLRKVCVWVPESRADELKGLAAKWRKGFESANPRRKVE